MPRHLKLFLNVGFVSHPIEVWSTNQPKVQELVTRKIVFPPQSLGVLGVEGIFVTKHSVEKDPTLASYLGLQDDRRKLANEFLRPTTFKDYCDIVSPINCTEGDGVAERYPDESEYNRFFVEGVYTGHFRPTDENDCDLYPNNCTGHIADYPCGKLSKGRIFSPENANPSNADCI